MHLYNIDGLSFNYLDIGRLYTEMSTVVVFS